MHGGLRQSDPGFPRLRPFLAWLHRDDLMPGGETVGGDPAAACIAARSADIPRMVEEGLIGEERAVTFRERAIGMCRDRTAGGSGPSLAGVPPQ